MVQARTLSVRMGKGLLGKLSDGSGSQAPALLAGFGGWFNGILSIGELRAETQMKGGLKARVCLWAEGSGQRERQAHHPRGVLFRVIQQWQSEGETYWGHSRRGGRGCGVRLKVSGEQPHS